jgi:predicted phosphodiesterase
VVAVPAATAYPPPHDVTGNVVVIVGDLVPNSDTLSLSNAIAVKNLTASLDPDKIIHAGDLQYECPTLALFNRDYDGVWGPLRDQIAPVIGNREYCNGDEPDAPGYQS